MSLKNTIFKNRDGFTIVELLIVVVVIAILAAITIVSYNGITNKANASSAKATASSVQKKIELYFADAGRYPIAGSELTAADKPYTLAGGTFGTAAPTANSNNPTAPADDTKGTNYVQLQACSSATPISASNVTGTRITYWDYEKSASQATTIDVGSCPSGTTLTGLN